MTKENDQLNQFQERAAETVIDSNKKIRIAFIGCGWIATSHINALKTMNDVEIVAAADLVPGKAQAFMEKHGVEGVKYYGAHTEMLADKSLNLDAVTICTYNATHAVCTIDSLNAGLHVLCEKPMCVTLDEAVAMRKAEKESGKILSIGFQPRFDENMKMIKKIVQSGELGKIYYVQTGGGRRHGIPTPYGTSFIEKDTGVVGALGDIGCYSLDMVLNALGYPKPLTVSGYTSDFFGTDPSYYKQHPEYADVFGVDDFAAAFVRLEGDIILDFRISWAMHMDTPGDTIILGTKGGLRIPSTECWNGTVNKPMTIYHDLCGEQVTTTVPILPPQPSLFALKIRAFLDACKNGTPSPISSDEIIINQAIIDGINRSAKLKKEIEIEIPGL